MLVSAIAFIQDNRFFSSAPKEALAIIKQRMIKTNIIARTLPVRTYSIHGGFRIPNNPAPLINLTARISLPKTNPSILAPVERCEKSENPMQAATGEMV